jgi:hypothetical protein
MYSFIESDKLSSIVTMPFSFAPSMNECSCYSKNYHAVENQMGKICIENYILKIISKLYHDKLLFK